MALALGRRRGPGYGAGVWWCWALVAACNRNEPVVSAVPAPDVQAVTDAREAAEARTKPAAVEQVYQKAPGVYVDVRFLAGRPYARIRDELRAQLGEVTGTRDLGELGEEKTFERGTLRVDVDGRIYMVAVPLPEPMRRSDALASLGLPVQVDHWMSLSREFRLNDVFGLRRVRMERASPGAEEVSRVEAWVYAPSERH